jgi:hypothetical protein
MTEKKKRDSRHYMRRIFINVFLCLLIALFLFANLPKLRQVWWQWQLNQAMKLWEQNEPVHYRYHAMRCALRCFHTIVTVENDEVVDAEEWRFTYNPDELEANPPDLPIVEPIDDLNYLESFRIESVFQSIQSNLNNPMPNLGVEYDSHYGYPFTIRHHLCEYEGTNPITGLCEPVNFTHYIMDFEVLSSE